MDNSDDYFTDLDFVLDEQTEAALVESEQKYLTQGIPAPVTKKLKTGTGWKPGPGARTDSFGDLDNLPEISLQDNGYYTLETDVLTRSPRLSEENEDLIDNSAFHLQRRGILNERQTATYRPHPNSSVLRHVTRHSTMRATATPDQQQTSSSPNAQTLGRSIPHPVSRQVSRTNSPLNSRNQSPSVERTTHNTHSLEEPVTQLQQQLTELRENNLKIQTALQEALEAKIAKEGEATILRKTIEKNSQSHAVQIAQLKVAKEEADAKQSQMQKEMKEETERLKTLYIFKQQELEASLRRAPVSTRGKRQSRELPLTPLAVSPSIRDWRSTVRERDTFSQEFQDSPTTRSQSKAPRTLVQKEFLHISPEKNKRPALLPGFQNSFVTSTPLRPTHFTHKAKLKAEDPFDPYRLEAPPLSYLPHSQNLAISQGKQQRTDAYDHTDLGLGVSEARGGDTGVLQQLDDDGDAVMIDGSEEDVTSDVVDILPPINWKAELSRVILTHIRPKSGRLTFQLLLSANLTVAGKSSTGSEDAYTSACSTILEVISNTTKHHDYERTLDLVSKTFIFILEMLGDASLLLQLASLLNLLAVLAYYIPNFRFSLLSHSNSGTESASCILGILCSLITTHLSADNNDNEHKNTFGVEILALVEVLCFQVSDSLVSKLANIPRNREVLFTLLHPLQPPHILIRTSHILLLLSTHHQLFRVLLSIPDPEEAEQSEEISKNVIIERLCSHLIDPNRDGTEYHDFKQNILAIIAQLSISHPDAHATLTASYVLIASLILYVAQSTTPLWEDNEDLVKSPEATASVINSINQCVYLIHHLVFSTDPVLNLRHKLQHAPQRPFNSILQMFIVTFGRLGYADQPDWIDEQSRTSLEHFTDMARDILELVVDGPEGDGVWNAYQEDLDGEAMIDEEEMEARLMGGDTG